MSEYTPATDNVRSRYIYWASGPMEAFDGEMAARGAEFDRWLAAHDREVEEAVVVRIAETVQNLWRKP